MLRFLRMLRENGKKLFLLTNSPYYFVDGGMRFMLEVTTVSESRLHYFFTTTMHANIFIVRSGSECSV